MAGNKVDVAVDIPDHVLVRNTTSKIHLDRGDGRPVCDRGHRHDEWVSKQSSCFPDIESRICRRCLGHGVGGPPPTTSRTCPFCGIDVPTLPGHLLDCPHAPRELER